MLGRGGDRLLSSAVAVLPSVRDSLKSWRCTARYAGCAIEQVADRVWDVAGSAVAVGADGRAACWASVLGTARPVPSPEEHSVRERDVHAHRVATISARRAHFGFIFSMGTEKDRRFGVLPRIQMGFSKGQFVDPLISSQTGPHSSFDSSLCPGVPIEVPR